MDFCPPNLKLWCAAILAAGALICPAQARDQKLIFSVPSDTDAVGSAIPDNSSASIQAADAYRAPAPLFNSRPSAPMPMPQVSINPNWQKAVDRQKNWMLMTPEEVMGISTPQKLIGLPDQNQQLTTEQRFLKRQEDLHADFSSSGATNNSSGTLNLKLWNDKSDDNPLGQNKSGSLLSRNNDDFNAANFAALKLASQSSVNGSGPSFNGLRQLSSASSSGSFSGLAFPSAPKVDNSAQVADMERFRALLGSSQPAPISPINDPGFNPVPGADPKRTSQFDALGHLTPASDDFNKLEKPATLSTLNGITPKPAPAKRESWQPQLPPWLMTGPPTAPPTGPTPRKF